MPTCVSLTGWILIADHFKCLAQTVAHFSSSRIYFLSSRPRMSKQRVCCRICTLWPPWRVHSAWRVCLWMGFSCRTKSKTPISSSLRWRNRLRGTSRHLTCNVSFFEYGGFLEVQAVLVSRISLFLLIICFHWNCMRSKLCLCMCAWWWWGGSLLLYAVYIFCMCLRLRRKRERLEQWLQAAEERAAKEEDLRLLQLGALQQRSAVFLFQRRAAQLCVRTSRSCTKVWSSR